MKKKKYFINTLILAGIVILLIVLGLPIAELLMLIAFFTLFDFVGLIYLDLKNFIIKRSTNMILESQKSESVSQVTSSSETA